MPAYADLEIHIAPAVAGGYRVVLNLNTTEDHGGGTLDAALPAPDGDALSAWFFDDDDLRAGWARMRGAHPQRRVRLRLDAGVLELRALPWEALRDPEEATPLAANDATPFSRYPAEHGPQDAPLPEKPLRVLVAVAAARDLAGLGMAPLDADAELAALREATAGLDVELVPLALPCTLPAIEEALRRVRPHVLHLIAHGSVDAARDATVLYLADVDNLAVEVPGSELVAMLAKHLGGGAATGADGLRLLFLASCRGMARRLGHDLIRAGVPAVVGMRADVQLRVARAFGATFYRELLHHGAVDLASNQARATTETRSLPDADVPVLLMHLPDGRLFRDLTGFPKPVRSVYTRVPNPRALTFVGREADLDWLCARLKRGDVSALAGTLGIGGIGKTELAIAAARTLDGYFQGRVLWLDCGPNDVLAIQARMAAALDVKLEDDDPVRRADALARAWRGQPPTLVVLDDVRASHLEQHFDALLPPRPPCALLITSRRLDLPLPPGATCRLDVLEPDDARDLLFSLLPEGVDADADAADAVAELLERIPLALTLAMRRLARLARRRGGSRDPWAALLRELRDRRARVLHQGDRPDLSVWVAFDLSYDDLGDGDKARLQRLGAFARNEFPLPALLSVWADEEPSILDALSRLTNAGLLEEMNDNVWWMHNLLHEYVVQLYDPEDIAGELHAKYFVSGSLVEASADRTEFLHAASYVTTRIMKELQRVPEPYRPMIELNILATTRLIGWSRGSLNEY